MVVYRTELINDNIKLINSLIESTTANIDKLSEDEYSKENNTKELNVLAARQFRLELERDNLKKILEQPYKEWTATFKCPGLAERVTIEARSKVDDVYGERSEFNEFENIKAKFELLLVEWDVKNKGKIVPIKQALKCDPDLLRAFSEEFEIQLNSYIFEERKK